MFKLLISPHHFDKAIQKGGGGRGPTKVYTRLILREKYVLNPELRLPSWIFYDTEIITIFLMA